MAAPKKVAPAKKAKAAAKKPTSPLNKKLAASKKKKAAAAAGSGRVANKSAPATKAPAQKRASVAKKKPAPKKKAAPKKEVVPKKKVAAPKKEAAAKKAAPKKKAVPKPKQAKKTKAVAAKAPAKKRVAVAVNKKKAAPKKETNKVYKRAVSYVIYHPEDIADKKIKPKDRRIFLVQRPANDANLPNVWGLPAGMHGGTIVEKYGPVAAAGWKASVKLSGEEKLGVKYPTVMNVRRKVGDGFTDRGDYVLQMYQYIVDIGLWHPPSNYAAPLNDQGIEKHVEVPQKVEGVTQYQRWRWGAAAELAHAADKGSLCSRIYMMDCGAVKKGHYNIGE